MSWFSSPFSLRLPPSPKNRGVEDDSAEDTSHPIVAGKGVKDDISEITKSLSRQFWGVASFLAPPPIERSDLVLPKHDEEPQAVQTESPKLAGGTPEGCDGAETNEDVRLLSEVVISGSGSGSTGEDASDSPNAGGQRLTGFRSDLAELRGTMATGFSRIQSVIRVVTQDEDEDEESDVVENPLEGSESDMPVENLGDEAQKNGGLNSIFKPLLVRMLSSRERPPVREREVESPSTVPDDGVQDDTTVMSKSKEWIIWDEKGWYFCATHGPYTCLKHHNVCVVQDPRPSVIASGINGLSKFASSLLPFARDIVGEFSGRDYFAVGLTNEVVTFANSIAVHPETWLDFPLSEEEDDDDFDLTEAQQEHAEAVKEVASRLAAVHHELCPAIISVGRFWKIYFVLLHSRLSKEDSELLSTPQVLKTRDLLLQQLKKEPVHLDTAPTQSERDELGITEYSIADTHKKQVVLKEHLESTAQSNPTHIAEHNSADLEILASENLPKELLSGSAEIEELVPEATTVQFSALTLDDDDAADADAWLEDEDDSTTAASEVTGTTLQGIASSGGMENIDEDVSFSDLEDDDNESNQGEGPEKPLPRRGIAEGVETPASQAGNNTVDAEDSHEDMPSGSKIERGEFNDWLTVNEEDAASTGSSSP